MTDLTPRTINLSFEDFKHQNGITYWWASEFMTMLGYDDFEVFKSRVIGRATQALITLGVDHYSQITPADKKNPDGTLSSDLKLTRFACYLIAMNGSPQKPEVAAAQAYFAQETRKMELFLENEDTARLIFREEFTVGQKSLMETASKSGVKDFATFNNAGYIGLYNKTADQLKRQRNLPDGSNIRLQDYMGRTELAANLFRVTQTEEKLRQDEVKTQEVANRVHRSIGSRIRQMVEENTGKFPEALPVKKRLPEVKKELKRAQKKLEQVDHKTTDGLTS